MGLTLELKNSLDEVDRLFAELTSFAQATGMDKKCRFQLMIAVEELFSNIVNYGYNDNDEHLINVSLQFQQGGVTIQIEDDGMPFNPLQHQDPDLTRPLPERDIGGLGIYLTKKMIDSAVYRRRCKKNILILKKNISNLNTSKANHFGM